MIEQLNEENKKYYFILKELYLFISENKILKSKVFFGDINDKLIINIPHPGLSIHLKFIKENLLNIVNKEYNCDDIIIKVKNNVYFNLNL